MGSARNDPTLSLSSVTHRGERERGGKGVPPACRPKPSAPPT